MSIVNFNYESPIISIVEIDCGEAILQASPALNYGGTNEAGQDLDVYDSYDF